MTLHGAKNKAFTEALELVSYMVQMPRKHEKMAMSHRGKVISSLCARRPLGQTRSHVTLQELLKGLGLDLDLLSGAAE